MKTNQQIYGIRILVLIVFVLTMLTRCAFAQNFTGNPQHVRLAEQARKNLAVYWFGEEFQEWRNPCHVTYRITSGRESAGGETGFIFHKGEVYGWRMFVQGSPVGIQSDSLPHEVNHTVFATKFRRPLPRWLDEGAAMFVESEWSHQFQRERLNQVIAEKRFIPFGKLFAGGTKYSKNLMAQYAEGFAITEYLINHKGGQRKFAEFTGDSENTVAALKLHYGYDSPEELEKEWYAWYQRRAGLG